MALQVGEAAPDFTLADQTGKEHSMAEFKGQAVLLYFYPKDDTPGCTKEACSFRDNFSSLTKKGVVVLGVSADSVKSHDKFAKKYDLPFLLLSDSHHDVVKAYGVWGKKRFMGREYEGIFRMSFLINAQGKIVKIYDKVKPENHVAEVTSDLTLLKS